MNAPEGKWPMYFCFSSFYSNNIVGYRVGVGTEWYVLHESRVGLRIFPSSWAEGNSFSPC